MSAQTTFDNLTFCFLPRTSTLTFITNTSEHKKSQGFDSRNSLSVRINQVARSNFTRQEKDAGQSMGHVISSLLTIGLKFN